MESGRFHTGQRGGSKGQQKSVFSQHLVIKSQYFVNKIFNIVSTNGPQNLKYTCQGTKNGNLEVDIGKRGEIWRSMWEKGMKFSAQKIGFFQEFNAWSTKINVWSSKIQHLVNKN